MNPADVMILVLGHNMTDDEIKDCIQQMMPVCFVKSSGFCLSISGFDQDERELWQIPEVIVFMKRLVNIGLIAGLEVSTQCPDLVRKEFMLKSLPGFGALEIWMAATGKLNNGDNSISQETMASFFKELNTANSKAKTICQSPSYKTGRQYVFLNDIPDGSVRHTCPKWDK